MPDQSPNESVQKPRDAHCGEECADGHTQAGRCTKHAARAVADAEQREYRDAARDAHKLAHRRMVDAQREAYEAAQDNARLRGERDRARDTAVELENQLAAVRDYLRYSDDDGIRTRETVLRMLDPQTEDGTP